MKNAMQWRQTLLASFVLGTAPTWAGEAYVQAGLPGFGLGYAHAVTPAITLRGDFVTLGSRSKDQTEDGIVYNAKLKTNRVGLFADWFVMQGSFRATVGLTSNDYKLDLNFTGKGNGDRTDVGGTSYTLGANDGITAQVKFPSTTPYVGIGWGHHTGPGWRFAADFGASLGKAKVTAVGRGQLATASGQASVDREVQDLRNTVGDLRFLPQLSVALGYSF